MTVASTISRIQYTASGSTIEFSFPYLFYDASHLKVWATGSDGIATQKTLGLDYTVSGAGQSAGGAVTFATPPLAGTLITIKRVVPISQSLDLVNNASFDADTLEKTFDLVVMNCQQLDETLSRAVTYSETSLNNTTDANNFLDTLSEYTKRAESSANEASIYANNASNSAIEAGAIANYVSSSLGAVQNDIAVAASLAEKLSVLQAYSDNAAALAILCQKYSDQAAMWPSGAPAYDPDQEYSFPEVAVYSDGGVYRCIGYGIIGESPADGVHWIRINETTVDAMFALTSDGDFTPASNAQLYSSMFEIDGFLNVMPVESPVGNVSFDLDADGNIQPIT